VGATRIDQTKRSLHIMRSYRLGLGLGAICLAVLSPQAWGAAAASRATEREGGQDPVAVLAARIDRHIDASHVARKATAAPMADDAEFIRRVYLDIGGRIPRVSEVRAFLADKRPDKRRRLVESLLAGPHYVRHFTHVWRSQLLPQNNNQQVQFFAQQIETWARTRLRENAPYDQMVRDLLQAPVAFNNFGRRGGAPAAMPANYDFNAVAFYQANEMKADNLAAATSRLFLGVKIECAQCHDHPFAKWTRKQFWEYTAFFAGIQPQRVQNGRFTPASDDPKVREIDIPNTKRKAQARFLDGTQPRFSDDKTARATLAEWMTRPENPFFARAMANRMWEHFFGIGFVDPVDDFRDENPASHPELLDEMARAFVANKFDIKFLIRAITASKAYQRTSARTDKSQDDLRLFARMPLKGLTPEQIFDSLATATGYRDNQPFVNRGFVPFGANNPRGEILTKFANPVDRRTEHQTSILQALALMNGRFIADATSLERSETLAAVIDSPFMDNRQRLDTLFMAALARPMRAREASRLTAYVTNGGPTKDSKKALADVFWVLLNSSEFILNH
jgi:hypothetical protein